MTRMFARSVNILNINQFLWNFANQHSRVIHIEQHTEPVPVLLAFCVIWCINTGNIFCMEIFFSTVKFKNRIAHLYPCNGTAHRYTVDGIIFVGTNFHGSNYNDTLVGFKIPGPVGFKIRRPTIFLHDSYRKLLFRGYWNLWIRPLMKTTKIGTQRKLSHPQYLF